MSATRVQHLLQDLHAACNSQRNQKKALRWAHSPLASKDLAIREAPPRAVLSRLIGISAEMARRLSIAFNTTPESWMRQQMIYDLWQARKKRLRVRRLVA